MADQALRRIHRELWTLKQSNELAIILEHQDSDVLAQKALIIGPPGTPYEFGFFEFSLKLPTDYPDKAPTVHALTTNSGMTRFNPNIYANGKVCLSILGTWRGEPGEQWSSAQGLESILISIQSLMSSNPYENEPGFEKRNSPTDQRHQANYVAKIKHETIRLAVIRPLEYYLGIYSDGTMSNQVAGASAAEGATMDEDDKPRSSGWEPFRDVCKRRFLWYFDSYLATINEEVKKHHGGTAFKSMPFESPGNTMDGAYEYVDLRRRLQLIRRVLDQEAIRWAEDGQLAVQQERPQATHMRLLFKQMRETFQASKAVNLDITLEDEANPFVWMLTFFGRPVTHLDGGMFLLRLTLSADFPDVWPRVQVVTPIFHHRVSTGGVLGYVPLKPNEIQSHLEAIVSAIEDEHPPYDPRIMVHPEAFRLFWGNPEERRQYTRRLRQSVERSMDG